MIVREIKDKDFAEAMQLHAKMALNYELNLKRPDFFIKNGQFEDGKLVAAVLARLTSESYLLLDKDYGTPRDRMDAVERLSTMSAREGKMYGVLDTNIWLPPKVSCFKRRLQRMGFVEAPWTCMTVRL